MPRGMPIDALTEVQDELGEATSHVEGAMAALYHMRGRLEASIKIVDEKIDILKRARKDLKAPSKTIDEV